MEENLAEWTELPSDSAVINNLTKLKLGDDSPTSPSPSSTSLSSTKSTTTTTTATVTTTLANLIGIAKLEVLGAVNFRPDSDYFLVMVFGTTSFRTKTIKKNFEGTWNAPVLLVVRENEKNFLVKFSLYSHNKFGQNELLAYCTLKMTDVLQYPNGFTAEIPMVCSTPFLPSTSSLCSEDKWFVVFCRR